MKPFRNTGTVLDEIEGEFRSDGKFAVSSWPKPRVSGGGNFFQKFIEEAEREVRERKPAVA